jgi:hypothetical protein
MEAAVAAFMVAVGACAPVVADFIAAEAVVAPTAAEPCAPMGEAASAGDRIRHLLPGKEIRALHPVMRLTRGANTQRARVMPILNRAEISLVGINAMETLSRRHRVLLMADGIPLAVHLEAVDLQAPKQKRGPQLAQTGSVASAGIAEWDLAVRCVAFRVRVARFMRMLR